MELLFVRVALLRRCEVDPMRGTTAGGFVIGFGTVSDLFQNQATRCYGADGGAMSPSSLETMERSHGTAARRFEQVPHSLGPRQHDHYGHRDESGDLARRRHCSRYRAPSAEED